MIISKERVSTPTAGIFFRQIAAMVGAGVPIKDALSSVAQDHSDLAALAQRYSYGASAKDGKTDFFHRIFTYLEKKAEPDQNIAAALYSIADEIEKFREFKIAMHQILFVPIMTLIVTGLLLSAIFIFVIPVWQEMFESMYSQLPPLTQMVILCSNFIIDYGIYIAVLLIGGAVFLVIKWESLGDVFSVLPMIRRLFKYQSVVRFTRYLSILLYTETPIEEAAAVAAGEVRTRSHSKTLQQAMQKMTGTDQLSSSLEESGFISNVVGRIINTGERSGTLAETLSSVSVLYEKEADIALARTVFWSDIVIKFIVGIVVGIIVISMYLPIFSMAGVI